jgi:hypothetical protein
MPSKIKLFKTDWAILFLYLSLFSIDIQLRKARLSK